jgi:hypothetical protein
LDLAVKARNYRNAELLITPLAGSNLTTHAGETPASAAQRVFTWAATPEGRYQRGVLGLPSLTPAELTAAMTPPLTSPGDRDCPLA